MESTALKAENLKPVILKAGIPLAVSLAGLVYAWIKAKKSLSEASLSEKKDDSSETNYEESFQNLSSIQDDEETFTPLDGSAFSESLVIHNNNNPSLEKEIIGLRNWIEDLQMRELALRLKFDQFCEMKEQESLLVEIKSMLSLEVAQVGFLDFEISSIERETMMLENFRVQYLSIIEQLEYWKLQNRMLQRKVQQLLRKSKAKSCLIKEQNLKIKANEEEISRNHEALKARNGVINKLEDEIKELQRVLDELQEEKNELLKKIETAEETHRKPLRYYLKAESGDHVSKEDYNQLVKELENAKKERASEIEELIELRKTNDWLRHELMKHQEQQKDHARDHTEVEFEGRGGVMHYDSDHELHYSFLEHHNVSCIGSTHGGSKKRMLLHRLKRWVDGSEKVRSVKPEIKCLGRHSVSYGSKKPEVLATSRFFPSA